MKNFFDSNDEKLTEKAFSRSLIISVTSILLCIVALCSATFAWFSSETTSSNNILTSGFFDFDISVFKSIDESSDLVEVEVLPDLANTGAYISRLTAGTYTVQLKFKKEATVKGHCVVKIGNSVKARTDAIFKDNTYVAADGSISDTLTFTIEVGETTTVSFEPSWGIAAVPDINYGDVIDLDANE